MSQKSPTQAPPLARHFAVQLSATRRGARLARLLTERQLDAWGEPYDEAAQVVAELASNAVRHGRVPGRDFRLRLTLRAGRTLRVEVTDARGDGSPVSRTRWRRTRRAAGACASSRRTRTTGA